MATAAIDLDDSDREAKIKERNETKTNANGRNPGNSKGRRPPKKKGKGQRNEDLGVRNSTESAPKRRGVNRKRDTQSKMDKQRSALIRAFTEKKTYLFDKRRDAEFMRDYNESDDDEPDWDPRLRAVKAKFAEITLRKKKDARKVWAEIEEAKTSSDSNESEKEQSHWDSKLRTDKSAIIGGDGRKYNLVNQKEDAESKRSWDADDEAAWFWDTGEESTLAAIKDTENEGTKHASKTTNGVKVRVGNTRESDESDEDPWFWDSNGNAPTRRGGTSKTDKDGKVGDNILPEGAKTQTPHLKVGALLRKSIEKAQLADFKRKYYENLNNPEKSVNSSKSSSSTSSDSTLSSEIEDMIRSPEERKVIAYRFLEDSSDDDEVITSTSKGWTIRRTPPVVAVKKYLRHHWSDESSMSSKSTSISDTEKSSGSQNDAATD